MHSFLRRQGAIVLCRRHTHGSRHPRLVATRELVKRHPTRAPFVSLSEVSDSFDHVVMRCNLKSLEALGNCWCLRIKCSTTNLLILVSQPLCIFKISNEWNSKKMHCHPLEQPCFKALNWTSRKWEQQVTISVWWNSNSDALISSSNKTKLHNSHHQARWASQPPPARGQNQEEYGKLN